MNNKLKLAVMISFLILVTGSSVFSTTRRVNNNTGVTGTLVYSTLSAAYTAAVAGDTLIIEGSNTTYGDLTIAKKLTIFGPGYHLTLNPQTQASLLTVTLGDITYNTGSAESLISGCKINSISVNANDITIARNYIRNSVVANASILLNANTTNTIIQQNIVWGFITNTAGKNPTVVIRNNLLGRVVFTETITSALISNNTIEYEASTLNGYMSYAIDVYNSTIINNIVIQGYYYYFGNYGTLKFDATQNNTISYNICNQTDPANGVGNNNVFAVDMATTFTGIGTGDIDKDYLVKSGSLAETGSQTGGECGMFGGDYKYVLSGLPPIPHIYMIDADPAGTNTDPLNVKISVKSQN